MRILGGGISGLIAAIQLKKSGLDVEVHEKKGFCGKKTNDFQFLENWTFEDDPLAFLRRIGIETDFYIKPKFSQEFLSPTLRKYEGRSAKPLMYLIKRGSSEDSIDQCLKEQAQRGGVTIKYHSNLRPEGADIIATGIKKPTFVTTGIKFRISHPETSIILLDNNISSRCYSYFIANEGVAEIVCANPSGTRNTAERLKEAVKRFEEILSIRVKEVDERFSSVVSFGFLHRAKIEGRYFVGEAAGFQDQLAGFGMAYAFRSGYLAARSIIEGLD